MDSDNKYFTSEILGEISYIRYFPNQTIDMESVLKIRDARNEFIEKGYTNFIINSPITTKYTKKVKEFLSTEEEVKGFDRVAIVYEISHMNLLFHIVNLYFDRKSKSRKMKMRFFPNEEKARKWISR